MKRAIATYGVAFTGIVLIVVLAVGLGGYILVKQRLSLPGTNQYPVDIEFSNSTGLIPGLGQPINVAGVRVGTIASQRLDRGVSVLKVEILRDKLPHVYRDATAVLVPNTPLKDMQVELVPGHPDAGMLTSKQRIVAGSTTSPLDSDDLLDALDADTRAYFTSFIASTGRGVQGRGKDLRSLFKALGPTVEQARRISDAVAARRSALRRLVHNLAVLGKATSDKDGEFAQVVDSANATLTALADQDVALRASVSKLPGTLGKARTTLIHATSFATQLGPTLDALLPAIRATPAALREVGPLARESEPVLRTKVRPLVKGLLPIARDLAPTTQDLIKDTPDLISAFQVLTYTVNELGYNPPGDDEGYLFWLAWFAHNADSLLSTSDAHGVSWRGVGLINCSALTSDPSLVGVFGLLTGTVPTC